MPSLFNEKHANRRVHHGHILELAIFRQTGLEKNKTEYRESNEEWGGFG